MSRCVLLVALVLLCGLLPATVLADDHDPKRIMPAEVMNRLQAGEAIVFLDTRTEAAQASGERVIPDSIHIKNADTVRQVIRQTPKDNLIVTYCT